MATVESGPGLHRLDVLPLPSGHAPYFHANMYLRMNVSQSPDQSSIHRERRVRHLPRPTTKSTSILGSHAQSPVVACIVYLPVETRAAREAF